MKLHRTLYLKLIFSYMLFFLASFIMISAMFSWLILNYLTYLRDAYIY